MNDRRTESPPRKGGNRLEDLKLEVAENKAILAQVREEQRQSQARLLDAAAPYLATEAA